MTPKQKTDEIKKTNVQACSVTGKTKNLTMHAHRNNMGHIIGWVFLNDEISSKIGEYDIEVTVAWEKEFKVIAGCNTDKIIKP